MPRIPRGDSPGAWHHVMNRAIARRTLFESCQDYRYFLARLAYEVRRGEIELHAFCLMGTHYHLLVQSSRGRLAEVMQRLQLAYSRWFNRSRRRDGTLVRGRYRSKLVHSGEYRRILVRYIDDNPRSAGLVVQPSNYPWGSARHYAREERPLWLERSWVEGEVRAHSRRARYRPQDYTSAFPPGDGLAELVEARLQVGEGHDGLDELLVPADARTGEWMRAKALLADGTRPGLPVLSLPFVSEALTEHGVEGWSLPRHGAKCDASELALVGLGRDLCGLRIVDLSRRIGASETKTRHLYRLYRLELEAGGAYADRLAVLAGDALQRQRGVRR